MSFQISGLPRESFAPLFALGDEALAARGARRMIADARPGFPCRVSLADAEPGERVILANYEHQSAPTPFRSAHAVFVRETAVPARLAPGETPPALRGRMLSLRSFDAAGMMLDADLVEGQEIEGLIERLLADPAAAYVHAHYARRGCYAARIDRA